MLTAQIPAVAVRSIVNVDFDARGAAQFVPFEDGRRLATAPGRDAQQVVELLDQMRPRISSVGSTRCLKQLHLPMYYYRHFYYHHQLMF